MEVLGRIEFGEVLTAWALHEWRGRLRPHLPNDAARLSEAEARFPALHALLQVRLNVVAAIVAAGITDCVRIRVTAVDVPSVLVMGAQPVSEWSKNKLAEPDRDGSADYVRAMAASQLPVAGPILTLGRRTTGPITVFDGMHRMAAWVVHLNAGRRYPLEVNLVLTERVAPKFEVPERGAS